MKILWALYDKKLYAFTDPETIGEFLSANPTAEVVDESNPAVMERMEQIRELAMWEAKLYGGNEVATTTGIDSE